MVTLAALVSPLLPRVMAEPGRSPKRHLTESAKKDNKRIRNAERRARARARNTDRDRDRDRDGKGEGLRPKKKKKKKIYVSL